MVASYRVQNLSRAGALSTLLYKCAMVVAKASLGSFRPSILIYTVNLRDKTVPQLPQTFVGVLSWHFVISFENESETVKTCVLDFPEWGRHFRQRVPSLE